MSGDWDEALAMSDQLPRDRAGEIRTAFPSLVGSQARVLVARGDLEQVRQNQELFADWATSGDVQERTAYQTGRAVLLRAEGRLADAAGAAELALAAGPALGHSNEGFKEALVEAVEASLEMGDTERAERSLSLVDGLPEGRKPQYLQAQLARLRARLNQIQGQDQGLDEEVEPGFKRAAGMFRELGTPYWLAVTLLEQAEWLVSQGRSSEATPLLNEAREAFVRLKAKPWIERSDRVPVMEQASSSSS